MKLGIVGLPNVGKSTLFNAMTKSGAQAENYPFCTIEPNVGVVMVPDNRLQVLCDMYNSKKIINAVIEFYDIAGLVRGASKGEGLGNKFLSHIREVEAIVHVVRCFEDGNVVHVDGDVDPIRDIETINYELILSDIEMIERRIEKTKKQLKADKKLQSYLDLLLKVKDVLEDGKSARSMELNDDDYKLVKELNLLSFKPVIYAANIGEDDLAGNVMDNQHLKKLMDFAKSENSEVIYFCAKIEEEIASFDDEDRALFLEELGIEEAGLDMLIRASYSLLNLMSFITAGEQEVRAWTIKKGTPAKQAAGKIHSDIERGFIRAETIDYDALVNAGSMVNAKEKGLVRLEGKEYIMQDGDVVLFRFNV